MNEEIDSIIKSVAQDWLVLYIYNLLIYCDKKKENCHIYFRAADIARTTI